MSYENRMSAINLIIRMKSFVEDVYNEQLNSPNGDEELKSRAAMVIDFGDAKKAYAKAETSPISADEMLEFLMQYAADDNGWHSSDNEWQEHLTWLEGLPKSEISKMYKEKKAEGSVTEDAVVNKPDKNSRKGLYVE